MTRLALGLLLVCSSVLSLGAPAGGSGATPRVARPHAYLVPARFAAAVEELQKRGLDVEELREDVELDVEVYRLDGATAAPSRVARRVPAGTALIRTGQRLGDLAATLLEPQARYGGPALFGAALEPGQEYPVMRLAEKVPLVTTKARQPSGSRGPKKALTPQMLDDGTLPDFYGEPVSVTWLDGEHFLQVKEGQPLKVHALTGRSQPYRGPGPARLAGPTWGEVGAASRAAPAVNGPARLAGLASGPWEAVVQQKEKGGKAGPGGRELVTPGPDKKAVAFVRKGNLYVEDAATKKERALTADGGESILNGKASWVYFEEVFNRRWQTYWWSPDGAHIAFLRTDEAGVPKATVVDSTKVPQIVEVTPYPRAGEPNPHVRLGIAPVAGGAVRWADLSEYAAADKEAFLITKVGWQPDGKAAYFCVQDRAQTWLDFCTVPVEGGKPVKLFRDTTKAWVEPPLPPQFLKDGSVLVTSERSGWKHLYHYEKGGDLRGQLTSGEWEVRSVQRVDEKDGWVYFSCTKDKLTATNAYRVKFDGTGLERLTKGKGESEVQFSPRGDLFVCTHSDPETPPQVRLHRADGTLVRTLDTNPMHVRAEFQQAWYERVQIKAPDGFLLEASVQKPADFDPEKKYPVWFMTYGGPRAPTVRDGFSKKGAGDQALANAGYVVFRGDPRSASGKGAVSAWACYRQMGVQELKDIETMIRWITEHPWADAKRVGMSGHSFGGYITAYALTHSKLFAAGVAGSPVTDWRLYDSIYTERYMDTPQKNPKGYEITSAVQGGKNLHGRLLLAHGAKDDNVHVGNTLQLASALQQANKDFEMMLYPLARHGIGGPHYQRLTRDFMKRVLRPEP